MRRDRQWMSKRMHSHSIAWRKRVIDKAIIVLGALIALLRTPIIDLALHIVGGSEAVLEQARRFLEIRWLSAPASLANLVLLGWLLGVQYARAPVILLVVGNILNIVLDVWLVMGLHMNVQGAALATVIAEYATLLIGLLMVRKILKLRGISGEMLKTAWRGNFRRLLALNRDIMLRSLLLQLCFGAITVLGARLGSDIIAVNAVLMTLLTFTAYALDGFAYAVEAHSGQAYGARDGSQLLDVWRAACRQSGIVALLFSVVYLLAGEHIIALLTSLTQIQQLADRYLIWQVILPLVGVWCYLLDGMFIGATRAAEMRNSMAVAAAGFALTLLTLPWLGNHGLWLALTVFLALQPQERRHHGESVVRSNLTKEQYSQMVRDAKEYIKNGDIFQIVLSQRFEISNPPDSFSVYRKLRATNPSPYLYYFHTPDYDVAGASPEMLAKVTNGVIHNRPIAGTKPRGRTPEEDIANEKALAADPKERAEHTMLVDLGRNDVGKVSEFGSVEVTRYMVTERASKVMHLVSDVIGKLRQDQTALDALMAILPAGTLSGAPKVRAMELIDQFENRKRGLYGGTVGYLGFDGNINTCIAIRTVLFTNDKAYVQAGAGIVADSVPENEYYETVNKALAVINAIKEAEQ